MRQISLPQVGVFMALFILVLLLAAATSYWGLGSLPLGDFRGVVLLLGGVVSMYVWAFVAYRLFLKAMPLAEGELEPGSRAEFAAQVNILFYLLLFNSLIRTHFLPVPLMRLVYLALGARLGPNTYSAGTLLDPPLTEFGANCIIGHDAVLYAHAIEGSRFALARIRIGDGVTDRGHGGGHVGGRHRRRRHRVGRCGRAQGYEDRRGRGLGRRSRQALALTGCRNFLHSPSE